MQTLAQESLSDKSTKELQEVFQTLPSGKAANLHGNHTGRILSLIGIDVLPTDLANLLFSLLSMRINPWRGKTFAYGWGYNTWLNNMGNIKYGAFSVEDGQAHDGSGSCLTFNYDVEENPSALRSIVGECRPFADGYLCRMLYKTSTGPVTILYFTLEAGDINV